MNILFFDTETTGLPLRNANWETDFEIFPHIVSISWSFMGEMKDRIIYPDSYEISLESTAIHGITTQQAINEGLPFEEVIADFINDCRSADKLVGFNVYFDTSTIKANILRSIGEDWKKGVNSALDKSKRIDLMRKTMKFVGMRKPNGSFKFPSLSDLYEKLFNEGFNAHSSKDDVMATEMCYLKCIELGIIEESPAK